MINDHAPDMHEPAERLRRWIRILSILEACHAVGLAPVTVNSLHAIAYLTEALAPVWDLEPLEGRILKQARSPYYPRLQQDVDRMIGCGLIHVDHLDISVADDRSLRLLPKFSLCLTTAAPILGALRELPGEEEDLHFLREVVQAFGRLREEDVDASFSVDASYGNRNVEVGQVIDLGEWLDMRSTQTSQVAQRICRFSQGRMSPAEIIDVYIGHISQRVTYGRY